MAIVVDRLDLDGARIDPPTTAALVRTIGADGYPIRGGCPSIYMVRFKGERRWRRVYTIGGGWTMRAGDRVFSGYILGHAIQAIGGVQ